MGKLTTIIRYFGVIRVNGAVRALQMAFNQFLAQIFKPLSLPALYRVAEYFRSEISCSYFSIENI